MSLFPPPPTVLTYLLLSALLATSFTTLATSPVMELVPETAITTILTKFGIPTETLRLSKGEFIHSLQFYALEALRG